MEDVINQLPIGLMSKAGRKEKAASLIDKYNDGDTFTDNDCSMMSNLCGYIFTKVCKVKHRMISVDCPSESYSGTWSWNKSINGYDESKNVLQAMRSAIRKGSYGQQQKTVCAICGEKQSLTVDHKTTPFKTISTRFIEEHGSPDVVNIDGFGWVLKDESCFIVYHDAIADYQTLCRSCNAKKGAK